MMFAALLLVAAAVAERPIDVSPCVLAANPRAFDRKRVRVTAFARHGFEDFSLFDPTCRAGRAIWLDYGGTVGSQTIYCCGPDAAPTRREPQVIDGITIPLLDDVNFRQFDALLQTEPEGVAHATLVGRFFSGDPDGGLGSGFGHFGMFSLLTIEKVEHVDDMRCDLDVRSEAYVPEQSPDEKCRRDLRTDDSIAILELQARAETTEPWRFTEPARVASDAVAREFGANDVMIARQYGDDSEITYEAYLPSINVDVYVSVSRPYWVSFYAANRWQIAWQPLTVVDYGCGAPVTSTRLSKNVAPSPRSVTACDVV